MFEPRSEADIVRLITEYPLAWVVSAGDSFAATPLPLLPECGESGELVSLLGHFARSNPQVARIEASPRVALLFQGPQAYVSPELAANRNWVPTWNYAVAVIEADIVFHPEENDHALRRLVDTMEAGRPDPWRVEETGSRYAEMAARIIAFRAHVRGVRGRFKLGQDENDETLAAIVEGFAGTPMAAWMQDFNPR